MARDPASRALCAPPSSEQFAGITGYEDDLFPNPDDALPTFWLKVRKACGGPFDPLPTPSVELTCWWNSQDHLSQTCRYYLCKSDPDDPRTARFYLDVHLQAP